MTPTMRRTIFGRRPLRLRLTVIYTGTFLLAGAALLAITYGLVARGGSDTSKAAEISAHNRAFKQACAKALAAPSTANANLIGKCRRGYNGAAAAGAASQRSLDLGHLLLYSLMALAVMALVSAALGWIVAGRALRPVHAITGAARRASEANLAERIGLSGPDDELKELADTFDAMLDRLDGAFSSQRRFVANASHELRTPLTLIRTSIDVTLAKPDRTPARLEQMAAEVRQAADSAEALIEALLTLARSDAGAGPREPVDLAVVAEDALDAAEPAIRARRLHVETSFAAAPACGDSILIERMIVNLVDNATRHNVPCGWIRVGTRIRGGVALLDIANSGSPIPEHLTAALFEPFRRLEERAATSEGVGLGLSIARSVAAAHHGQITARGRPDGGLEVSVRLPAASPP
jgi:signal transduction histidine kinase